MRPDWLSFGQGRIVGFDGICEFHGLVIDVLSSVHTSPSIGQAVQLNLIAFLYLLTKTVLIMLFKDLLSKPLW
jgi:hypothetical protein